MADYGVNIAVAVKNSQAVTQLSNKIKDTAARIEDVNSRFTRFANMTGKLLPGSIANFNKALSNAAKNLSDVALNTEDAVTAAREFVQAQNAANAALKERDRLIKQVRREGATVREQPFGAPGISGGPQLPEGFNPVVGRQRAIAQMVMLETAADVKIADAKRKHVLEIGKIQLDLDRKIRNAEIDNIIEEYKIQNQFEDAKFRKLMKNTELFEARFFRDLGIRKSEEIKAIKEVEQERRKAARQTLMLTGQTSPIGGAENISGSPAAKRKAERDQIFLRDKFNRERRLRSATSSALIGGAFPLLFGQGLGAAAGGAAGGFGGGMIGGEFGFGLSLVGTQVGSLVDQLVQNAINLGKALNPLTASSETIIAAVGKADTEFALLVNELDAAGQSALALQLATEELEKVVGLDGVEALEVFSAGIKGLQNDFTIFVTQLSATVAGAINALTGETSFVREIRDLSQGVFEARQSKDPEIIAAVAELDKLQGFGIDPKDRIAAQEKIVKLLKEGTKTRRDNIELAAKEEKRLTKQVEGNEVAREARYLVAAQIRLAEVGNDLTNEAVILARKNVIQERYLAEARGHSEGSQQQLLAADRKALALRQLAYEILQAETAEKKRQQRISERNEEKLRRLQQRAAEQREQQEIRAVEAAGALIDRLYAERELRLAILDGTEEQVIKEQRIEKLMQGQREGMRGIVEQYVELESEELKAIKRVEQLDNLYAGIGQTIETGVVDMITAATDKTKSLAEAASNTLRQLANQLLSFGLGSLGGNDGVGFFSRLFPKRALGGSVSSNRPYMVGERGPELFVPGAQGNVVPNNALGGANVVVNVDASGSQAQGNQPNAKALGAAIGAAVQAELVKQKRPGGLLS